MAPPPPFGVEQWMDVHETSAKYNIAETCCASISIKQLATLSETKDKTISDIVDLSLPQTYGEIRGSSELRSHLARLYSTKVETPLSPDLILITPGAIAANHLVLYSLIRPGDHVICHYPTYQQLYSIPASLGARVDFWKSDSKNSWIPDLDELKSLVNESTKLVIINNPQNPTGQILPKSLLQEMTDFLESKNITILSDEVYRPIFHGITPVDQEFPPSILSLGFKNVIATGSMSKAYSLAGIRVGWVASRDSAIIEQCASTRDYTTISVSKIDQEIASHALAPHTIHNLLGRNIQLAKTNLELVERFVIKHDEYCSWTKPIAGTTAFIKFERDGKPVNAAVLCMALQEKTGVMILPGDVGFGSEFKGYVRLGFVNETAIVKDALEEMRKFMRKDFNDIPWSD